MAVGFAHFFRYQAHFPGLVALLAEKSGGDYCGSTVTATEGTDGIATEGALKGTVTRNPQHQQSSPFFKSKNHERLASTRAKPRKVMMGAQGIVKKAPSRNELIRKRTRPQNAPLTKRKRVDDGASAVDASTGRNAQTTDAPVAVAMEHFFKIPKTPRANHARPRVFVPETPGTPRQKKTNSADTSKFLFSPIWTE